MKPIKFIELVLVLLLLPAASSLAADGRGSERPATPAGARALQAVTFTDINAGLPGVAWSSAAWGDYDGDGDLDLLLTGNSKTLGYVSFVYRNDGGGAFTDIDAGIEGVDLSSVAWGDYDNDGDLDILMCGYSYAVGRLARIYRNDGGTFTDLNLGLPDVCDGSVAWGDYDNDGDLDFVLTGYQDSPLSTSRVYRNNGNETFTDIGAGLPGLYWSAVAWADYDNDGDLDLLVTGDTGSGYASRLYRNDAGKFYYEWVAPLPGVGYSAVAWGDYDNDGDLDLLLAGNMGAGFIARVYRNEGAASFTDIGAGLPGFSYGTVAWGDYDNDGNLDILLSGFTGSQYITRVYHNDGAGTFTDLVAGLTGVFESAAVWGDYDNDGDLDFVLAGDTSTEFIARVYRNDGAPANTPPAGPGGLSALAAGDHVTLSWTAPVDAQTPAAGLSYNLRVGTTPGGCEVTSAMADAASGYRRVVQLGNTQPRTSWTLDLPLGRYYWSAQAVDGAYAGSPFAPEQSFTVMTLTDIGAGLPGVHWNSAAWGDYDGDGDLDVLLAGDTGEGYCARVYRNDGAGAFTDVGAGLPGVAASAAAWGDCDNDGDLDLVLTGDTGAGYVAAVHRNDGAGVFTDVGAGLPGVRAGSVSWGDCDNDGDLDLLLTGYTGAERITRIYLNRGGGVFADLDAGLPGVGYGAAAWGDCDNDGDLDLVLSGHTGSGYLARVYRNDGAGAFTDVGAGLPGVCVGSVAWGDYDADGDLDLVLSGHTGSECLARLYRNDGAGGFTDIGASLAGADYSSAAWGDCDNDGDLDLVLAGWTGAEAVTRVYCNEGGGKFTALDAGLPGAYRSSVAWGDHDGDGDLDLLLAGYTSSGPMACIYRSHGAAANAPPSVPGGLTASVAGGQATLSWEASSDTETPAAGLSYNLRVGTTPGGSEVTSAMADGVSGLRRVAQLGNAQQRTSWTVDLPTGGQYYWSVQAVDGAHAGSPFATEHSFFSTTEVADEPPKELSFALISANPVVGAARFSFGLPAGARVELAVYDLSGRRVATLVDTELPAGYHTARWGAIGAGAARPAGVYFVRFAAEGRVLTRRVVVLE
jgi:hypothetical protein